MALHDELAWHKLLLECQTEAASDGILTVSASGVLLVLNGACREMWSLSPEVARPGVDQTPAIDQIAASLVRPALYTDALRRIASDPFVALTEQLTVRDGREVRWINRPILDRQGQYHGRVGYYSDITRMVCAERDALANEARTRAVVYGACDAIVSMDDDLHILDLNPSAGHTFGWNREEALWNAFDELAVADDSRARFVEWVRLRSAPAAVPGGRAEFPLVRQQGGTFLAECAIAHRGGDAWVPITLFVRDISVEKRLEAELRQAQKLESVGRLASGIAHEINTPMQFVGDSLYFIRESVTDLLSALDRLQALRTVVADNPQALELLEEVEQVADLAYLTENAPKALDRAAEGLARVSTLVQGMKEFAHPSVKKAPADLNRALQTTLTIARNEYKLVAEIDASFGEVPPVTCTIGEINQAFLNIIVNAAHAIADTVRTTSSKGRIGIRTWQDGGSAFVAISDTGGGIPEAIRHRIFDPFFTTKEVGRGTGQGLAIARSVVVDKHGGELAFDTRLGQGTTFTIRLPLETLPADG